MLSYSICLGLMKNLDENNTLLIWAVLGTRENFNSLRVFWNKSLLALNEPHFLEWITCKIFEPSSWCFFWNCAKFDTDFKNAIKLWEIVFCFQDNCVPTVSWNFSQLWGENMWSTLNVLMNSLYILDLIEEDVFQFNFCWIKGKLE